MNDIRKKIKQAITEAGKTCKSVSNECGVCESGLNRFVNRRKSRHDSDRDYTLCIDSINRVVGSLKIVMLTEKDRESVKAGVLQLKDENARLLKENHELRMRLEKIGNQNIDTDVSPIDLITI